MYRLTSGNGVVREADNAFIPNDPANADWKAYQAWVAAGNTPTPYAPPAVPQTIVSPRQIRLALTQLGYRTQVENAVKAGDQTLQDNWQFASQFDRNNSLVTDVAKALGVSDAQLDELWNLAAKL